VLAADGDNNGQIARRLGVSLDMVPRWRERWIALEEASLKGEEEEEEGLAVEERLTDAPRPGKPRTITPEQE
jgi:putative transposase